MDGYNIKIGLDSRGAERGVRSFSSALGDSLKALRTFDDKARSAFKALDQFSKLNGSNLNRSVGSISSAVERLNRLKVSRGLVNNLQTLQKTLSGIRFNGADSLAKLPGALKALETIKINSKVVSDLNALKGAIKGFASPPKTLASWPKALAGFSKVQINPALAKQAEALKGALRGFTSPSKNMSRWAPTLAGLASIRVNASLPRQLEALKIAFRGFNGPSKSALGIPKFLAALAKSSLNPGLANNLAKLKASITSFPTISARAGANLTALFTALKSANPSDINRVAAALMKLNGLNINIGRSLANLGNGGRNLGGFAGQIGKLTNSMRGLYQQTMIVHDAMGMLQTVLGGLTFTTFIKGIYDAGNSWMALTRTLGAVSTSQAEVEGHLQFIRDLTSKMPVSIEAAAESYRKFAVAARLAGMSTQETQGIFEDFSIGFSAMGLSVDSQKFAFIALEQMISKGNITMEELKTQLGDHLPGAVQILSQALDVPVAKLFKMIENGEVTGDALIKMGKKVRTTFQAAADAAVNSSQGQFIALQNSWYDFQKRIFNSDFNAALGALAGTISDVFKSDDMKAFADDIGKAFARLFKAAAALVNFLAENRDTVITFMKGFAAYGLIVSTAYAFRLLVAPLGMLAPALGLAAAGFRGLGTAIKIMASGQALAAVTKFFNFFSKRLMLAVAGVAVLGGAVYWLMGVIDELTGTKIQGVLGDLGNTSINFARDALGNLKGVADSVFETIDGAVNNGADGFDERMRKINEAELTSAEMMEKRRQEEEKMAATKAKTLSKEAETLWDKLNAVGKENEEYQKQLKLLDEIAKKRGLSDGQKEGFRKVLDAQSLEDRNPIGGSIKDMRDELDTLQAKTAEQKAFNAAKEWEQNMLKKGVVMTTEEWAKAKTAMQDYSLAVAKMNGEVGNGIERWVAKVGDFNDQVQDAISDGIGGLTDELSDFLSGAEADFAGLARSILKSFIKISLDGILKDMFTSMGINPMKSGRESADAALSKLANLGETITTAQTNVYTSGLSINGSPVDALLGGDKAKNATDAVSNLPAVPTIKVERKDLPLLPGTQAMSADDYAASPIARKVNAMQNRVASLGNIPTQPLSNNVMSLTPQEITDLKKTVMTEWIPSQGEMQGKGVIDTILNRKASGKWGSSITDVVNADRQFSAINGPEGWKAGKNSVSDYSDELLTSGKGKMSADLVDKYLAERAAGAASSVGTNLNYANPNQSDAKNQAWIDKLQGPTFGEHKHGTTADLEKFRPDNFGIQLPGQQTDAKNLGIMGISPTATANALGTGSYKEIGNFVARGADKVDPELRSMIEEAAKRSGLEVAAYSGYRPATGKNGGTGLHTQGLATDVQLRDPNTGKIFGTGNGGGHYQTAEYFRENERFAQTVKQVADERGMGDQLRWGGYFSSKTGPRGYGALDGMHYDLGGRQGRGMAGGSWANGLTPEMRAAYPGIQSVGLAQGSTPMGVDQTTTNSIQSANAALKETGNALNQAMPGFQNLETKVQQTGTSAMTSGQQLQQAEQMKMVGEQQQIMSSQQAGIALQTAGSNASMAGPEFQQAGQAIAQAGAAAGQGAQAASAGASGGLGQLSSIIGMIPGLGQYGGLLSSFFGMFSEGGYATSPVSKMRVPHYAEGTANTSGGLPAVLHPNEAVIPLSRGRKVPVEIDSTTEDGYKSEYGQARQGGPTTVNLNLYGVSDGDSFKRSKRQAQSMMASAMQRTAARDL